MFADWVKTKYNCAIHESTARLWMQELGFSRIHHQKGVYSDGDDRVDVIAYRNEVLGVMNDLDKKSLVICGLIRVAHDECTYFANCDQSLFSADEQTNVLRQKSLRASIMVSDFIDAGSCVMKQTKRVYLLR